MSKKILIVIAILIVLAVALVAIFVSKKKPLEQPLNTGNSQSPTTFPTVVIAQQANSILSFSPLSLSASQSPQQLPITIESSNDVTAVQLELTFDPEKITNVDVTAPKTQGFFDNPTVLLKNVDKTKGRITFAFGISPAQSPKKGNGTVAVLSFTPKLTLGEQTQINFLPKTLVTAIGVTQSVLKSASNATITGQ